MTQKVTVRRKVPDVGKIGREVELFDERPIELDGFHLRAREAVPVGRPNLEQWTRAFVFACGAQQSSPYWIGDLLEYAEDRDDWRARVEQAKAMGARNYQEKTLSNLASVSRAVKGKARDVAPTISHAAEVASMPPDDQIAWLDKARTEGWSVSEFRLQIRASKRRKVIEGQAVLEGQHRVLVADPPWRYHDSGVISGSAYARAESSYDTMSIEELCALPVEAHLLPNATAFIWVPVPLLFEHPGPREVIEAWGLTYKSHRVWDKVTGMPSNYAQQITHEILLICTRGDGKPDEPTPHEPSIFRERVRGEHSEKPNAYLRHWIEKHWTIGPYLELFGREPVDGWTVFGNDARLWGHDAAKSA